MQYAPTETDVVAIHPLDIAIHQGSTATDLQLWSSVVALWSLWACSVLPPSWAVPAKEGALRKVLMRAYGAAL